VNILLHACCGPCTIYPLSILKSQHHDITAYFNNPNIHPYKEFKRRLDTLQDYSKNEDFPLVIDDSYGLTEFLQLVVFKEKIRCPICYEMRLKKTVEYANEHGFDGFSTTLLYSRYQNHAVIIKICEKLAKAHSLHFVYEDFRIGWQEGIDLSIEKDMYRQPYCGCIYSEQERYDKSLRKKIKKSVK
jgi:predicted adenine nucleotide alpha hydrolase (AANH) superfamily ATPase